MKFHDLLYRIVGFSGFLVSALICVLAAKAYQETHKRCLLLIAASAGLAVVVTVLPELGPGGWGAWYFDMVMRVAGDALWLVGCWLLFEHYMELIARDAQGDARPNGGPAVGSGNSGVGGGPPSVS